MAGTRHEYRGTAEELYVLAPRMLEGKSGIAFYGDNPPKLKDTEGFDLAFSSVKALGVANRILPLPDPYSISWKWVGNPEPECLMREFLSNNAPPESEKMFWIGANTHPVRKSARRVCSEVSRYFGRVDHGMAFPREWIPALRSEGLSRGASEI